jgi:PIN domain nuclease of toxin-antitoxin system
VRLLLDSHAFVWYRTANRKLGRRARTAIEREAAAVWISVASAWELAIKVGHRGVETETPVRVWIPAALESSGFQLLPIALDHALAVASLPAHHADPFDRLLIAQARAEGLTIVTADVVFEEYDVKLLDART